MVSQDFTCSSVLKEKIAFLRLHMDCPEFDDEFLCNMLSAFCGDEQVIVDLWKKALSKAEQEWDKDFYQRFGHVSKPKIANTEQMCASEAKALQAYLDAYNTANEASHEVFHRVFDQEFFDVMYQKLYSSPSVNSIQ